jgi:hypothetical protein
MARVDMWLKEDGATAGRRGLMRERDRGRGGKVRLGEVGVGERVRRGLKTPGLRVEV